jgi:hypothetical protein
VNTLRVQITSGNGLSFDLLIEGQRIGELIDDGNEGIPYWIVEDDLPYWPPHAKPAEKDVYIVSVCSCGEYGCGHSRSQIEKGIECVILQKFEGDVGKKGEELVYEVSRQDYDEAVSIVVREANMRKRAVAERQ